MMTALGDWLLYLKYSNGALGFPLVVAGLVLMLFGWRMWKVCVMLAYGSIGTALGAWAVGACDAQWTYAITIGATLALISYWPVNCAVSLLGGLIGAVVVMYSLENIGVSGTALFSAGGTALIVCTAFAFLNRRHVVIIVTSFLGAVLVLSGLTAWVMKMPVFYSSISAMVAAGAFVVPFILMVPTVMSSFYQISEVRRLRIDI